MNQLLSDHDDRFGGGDPVAVHRVEGVVENRHRVHWPTGVRNRSELTPYHLTSVRILAQQAHCPSNNGAAGLSGDGRGGRNGSRCRDAVAAVRHLSVPLNVAGGRTNRDGSYRGSVVEVMRVVVPGRWRCDADGQAVGGGSDRYPSPRRPISGYRGPPLVVNVISRGTKVTLQQPRRTIR